MSNQKTVFFLVCVTVILFFSPKSAFAQLEDQARLSAFAGNAGSYQAALEVCGGSANANIRTEALARSKVIFPRTANLEDTFNKFFQSSYDRMKRNLELRDMAARPDRCNRTLDGVRKSYESTMDRSTGKKKSAQGTAASVQQSGTQTTGKADPRAPLSAFDPLAPGGINTGMSLSEVDSILSPAGFVSSDGWRTALETCKWLFTIQQQLHVEISVVPMENSSASSSSKMCTPEAIVRDINYSKTEYRSNQLESLRSAEDIRSMWIGSLGDPSLGCNTGPGPGSTSLTTCNWLSESKIENLQSVFGRYLASQREANITFQYKGVDRNHSATPTNAASTQSSSNAAAVPKPPTQNNTSASAVGVTNLEGNDFSSTLDRDIDLSEISSYAYYDAWIEKCTGVREPLRENLAAFMESSNTDVRNSTLSRYDSTYSASIGNPNLPVDCSPAGLDLANSEIAKWQQRHFGVSQPTGADATSRKHKLDSQPATKKNASMENRSTTGPCANVQVMSEDKASILRPLGVKMAAQLGDLQAVCSFVSEGVDFTASGEGQAAFYQAARFGHFSIVEALVIAGADVDAVDQFQQTALYSASAAGRDEVVRVLLAAGADTSIPNRMGMTPLFAAQEGGFDRVVKLLTEVGAQ